MNEALRSAALDPVPRPVVLNVGITGHRAGVLTGPLLKSVTPVVATVFRQLRKATLSLQKSEAQLCSETAAELRLHTAMATGADQIAATCARSSGYYIRALLPFDPAEYRYDFADGSEVEEFEQALADADEVVALPGDRADLTGAYVNVGKSLVDAADVMIAIWDGEAARGPGGTAHVVELALQNSVPVIHINIDRVSNEVRTRLLVQGDTPVPIAKSRRDPILYGLLRDALKLSPPA